MCVCVCVFSGRVVGPTGEQKSSRLDDVLNLFRPILAQGRGKGYPKINTDMKKYANANSEIQKLFICCYAGRFSQKMEGSTAGRLPTFLQNNNKTVI